MTHFTATSSHGEYIKPMQDLGQLMGFKVIEEGGRPDPKQAPTPKNSTIRS